MSNFLQVQGNRRHCAEAYSCTPHKRFQTCHAQGVIDADLSRTRRGIAGKGHLWTETGLKTCCRRKTLSAGGGQIDTKPTPVFQGRKKRDFSERLDQDSSIVINRQYKKVQVQRSPFSPAAGLKNGQFGQ
ncbi:MAG: hypothetical protein PVI36_03250 [Desulfobacterales bacterium]|jgi:hypothetical protein